MIADQEVFYFQFVEKDLPEGAFNCIQRGYIRCLVILVYTGLYGIVALEGLWFAIAYEGMHGGNDLHQIQQKGARVAS